MDLRFLMNIALVMHLSGIKGSQLILDNYNFAEESQVDITLSYNTDSDESSDDSETDKSSREISICKTLQWDNLDKTLVNSLEGMGKVDIIKMKQEFKRLTEEWEQSELSCAENMKKWFLLNRNYMLNLTSDFRLDNFLSSINKKGLAFNYFDKHENINLDESDRNKEILQLHISNMDLWDDLLIILKRKDSIILETSQWWSYISQEMLNKDIWVQKFEFCNKYKRLTLLLRQRMKKIQKANYSAKSNWKENIIRILSWHKLGINEQCMPKALEFQLERKTAIIMLLKYMQKTLIIINEAIIMENDIMKSSKIDSTYDFISRSIFNGKMDEYDKRTESMSTFKSNMHMQWNQLVSLEKEHKKMDIKCKIFTEFLLENKEKLESKKILHFVHSGKEEINFDFFDRHGMIKYISKIQKNINEFENNYLTLSGNLQTDITEMQKMIDQDLCFDDYDILLKNFISKEYFHKVSQLLVIEDWDLFCWNKELAETEDNEHV